jgi:hypothetical protein
MHTTTGFSILGGGHLGVVARENAEALLLRGQARQGDSLMLERACKNLVQLVLQADVGFAQSLDDAERPNKVALDAFGRPSRRGSFDKASEIRQLVSQLDYLCAVAPPGSSLNLELLANVFRETLVVCDFANQLDDPFSKQLENLAFGARRIFEHVVKECGNEQIQIPVTNIVLNKPRHLEAVTDVRSVALVFSYLAVVHFDGELHRFGITLNS